MKKIPRRSQHIRTKVTNLPFGVEPNDVKVGGWLSRRDTYLRLEAGGRYLGCVDGQRLLRLAKAIVRHMEA